jgi:hypothetical protein
MTPEDENVFPFDEDFVDNYRSTSQLSVEAGSSVAEASVRYSAQIAGSTESMLFKSNKSFFIVSEETLKMSKEYDMKVYNYIFKLRNRFLKGLLGLSNSSSPILNSVRNLMNASTGIQISQS